MDQEKQFAQHRLRFAKRRLSEYVSNSEEHVSPESFRDALERVTAARRELERLAEAG